MTAKWTSKARKTSAGRPRGSVWKAARRRLRPPPPPPGLPADVASALEPGEAVRATFGMSDGLQIYATDTRFIGRRDSHVRDVSYSEISDARRRTSNWRGWRGIARTGLGAVFIASGLLTGFGSLLEAAISLGLFLVGGAFVFLGVYRRDDWVELKIDRKEPPPSFWYIIIFLPFWLLLQSRKRYKVAGNREQVDAFYEFVTSRLASRRREGLE